MPRRFLIAIQQRQAMTDISESGQFKRVLVRRDVLAMGFGAMVGWGWVVLTGEWILAAGSLGAILAFLIGGTAIVLVGLTYAELASAMPLVGGEHVYSYRALGHLSSFVCTWAISFGYVTVVAFEAVALPTVIEYLFPGYSVGYMWTVAGWDVNATWVAVGVAGAVAMAWINHVGIRTAALFQYVVTAVMVVVGVLFVTGALFQGEVAQMAPLFGGVDGRVVAGVMAVIIMVPFMFVGFDVVPQVAEEVNLPFHEIGRLLMFSILGAVAWYCLIILGTSMALDDAALAASSLAVPDAAANVFGAPWAGKLVVLAGVAGIVTSWNAFYAGGSRAIYALARTGMLPAFLGYLHPRHKTPTNAILLMGMLSCLAPLLGRPALVWLVVAGGLGIVIAYLYVALSFLVLRHREPELNRPFRVRWGRAVGAAAALSSLALVVLYMPGSPAALQPIEWMMFGGWMLLGVSMYAWSRARYGVAHSDRMMEEDLAKLDK